MQVADRWHLLHNFRQVLERFFWESRGRLQDLPGLARLPVDVSSLQPRTKQERNASKAARQRRYDRYMQVRRLCAEEALNITQISQRLGMSRVTVRKYLAADCFPEWSAHPTRPGVLALHEAHLAKRTWRSALGEAHLAKRWAEGERSAPRALPRVEGERLCRFSAAAHAAGLNSAAQSRIRVHQ